MNHHTTDAILLTPTWAGDLEHFRLLRASLRRSALATLEHHVVVQTEDLPLFAAFADEPGLVLRSTADVLPPEVEHHRQRARAISARTGRHLTRVSGSLRRTLGWPRWPSYTGWHTQQLCKFAIASEHNRTAIVLDSDVVVTPWAQLQDFYAPEAVVCFARWQRYAELRGKVRKWVDSAVQLTDGPPLAAHQEVNTYFDTPFVLDGDVTRALLNHLERRSGLPWWQHLLNQPPRRWSEFGLYKQFLGRLNEQAVEWRHPDAMQYIYDTSDASALVKRVTGLFHKQDIHYITLHSQSSGKYDWNASQYVDDLLNWICERPPHE